MIVLSKVTKEGAVHKLAIPVGSVGEVTEQLDGGCWVKYRSEFDFGTEYRSVKVDMSFDEVMAAIEGAQQ